MELEDLPDSEIRQRLIALGHNVGPLTPTTRAVHIKKLKNLLSMQGENAIVHEPTPPPSFSSGDGTNQLEIFDSEPIVEDEPALTQLRAPPVMPETPRAASMTAQSPQLRPSADAGDSSDGEMWGEESVRYLSPEEMELEMNYNRTSAASNVVQTGNFRKMMIVAFLMALVVFVFFLSDRVHRQTAGGTVEDEL
ncbi:LEM domain-containing protein [Trichostrongylus colubriformis]|uniref:LEM domain-containing protein n=1 Tax=Trichostrongylus colubriformis TaxID=6319 RepID=A0AAN8F4F3_TRICO